VKLENGKEKETLERLEAFYKQYNPGFQLDYYYLDQAYQKQYVSEMRVATLSRYFAGMAVIISCLGLFGLTAFTAEKRVKEIGIRKVLGSSQWQIIYLLSGDFTKMVLLAVAIALPTSYLICAQWLGTFAYRTTLELWFFVGAGVGAIAIAWLTVGLQTFRASRVNPVNCLKSE
jgi:ABC-type antimicrobial peptide transport system permease subunit